MRKARSQDTLPPSLKPALFFLGSQMETGGAQRVLLSQAEWFYRQGYPVVVAFLYDKENLRDQWAQRYPFPIVDLRARVAGAGKLSNSFHLVGGLVRLMKLVSANKFSAIETFTHHANLIGLPIAAMAGIPVRIATHHGRIHALPKALEKLHTRWINSNLTTRLVVVSEGVYRAAIEEGVHPKKITTIPNGISVPSIANEVRKEGRAELYVPADAQLIVSVGRLTYEKGHTFLIQAIPEVVRLYPRARFFIAGDGALRTELEAEAEKLGVSGAVRFLGIRADIPRLLAAADLFVLPSRSEGLPMALLEAMGMSLPVVAANVGGVGQVVKDGVTGLLVPPGDPAALAEAIRGFLADEPRRTHFAAAARELILQNYSTEKMCRQYQRLFSAENEEIL